MAKIVAIGITVVTMVIIGLFDFDSAAIIWALVAALFIEAIKEST